MKIIEFLKKYLRPRYPKDVSAFGEKRFRDNLFFNYYAFFRELFRDPNKTYENKKEFDLIDEIGILVRNKEVTNETVETIKQMAEVHRVLENTKARKRLEKWSSKIIATYLLLVFVIITINYTKMECIGLDIRIPDSIITTILATTTINVIGLVIIVLRGYFLAGTPEDKDLNRTSKDEDKDKE